MSCNYYDLGDTVLVEASFRDPIDGGPIDPDQVHVAWRKPDGELVEHSYEAEASESDGVVLRDELGEYHALVDVDQAGEWFVRWHSTGLGKAAAERSFLVKPAVAIATEESS